MNNKRRSFLKQVLGSSAGGVLLSSSGLVNAAINNKSSSANHGNKTIPTILLTSNEKIDASFGAGVKAALLGSIELSTTRVSYLDVIAQFNQIIHKGGQTRIIGMVDTATSELLMAQARHVGARISWFGQHMSDDQQSHHQLINSHNTQESLLLLATKIKQNSSDFNFNSELPYITIGNVKESNSTHIDSYSNSNTDLWAANLGYALAAPKANINFECMTDNNRCLTGQYFSFVIEV